MSIDYRVISIGALAAHPLWDETSAVRTGHTTTTLISAGSAHILVDPSLPAQVLAARLSERTPIKPDAITHVFLTSLQPERRRAIGLFEHAHWLALESEMQAAQASVEAQLEQTREMAGTVTRSNFRPPAAGSSDMDDEADAGRLMALLRTEQQVLARVQPAEDSLAQGVDLFPLPGVTVGTCGLLLALPGSTVLVTGDAVATLEHLQQGAVLPHCVDLDQARESFREAVEIADALILGRDGLTLNPMRSGQAGGMPATGVRHE